MNKIKLGALAGSLIFLVAALTCADEPFWTEAPKSSRGKPAIINMPNTFAPLAEKSMPAVVTVYTKKKVVGHGFFFGPVPFVQEGAGSGFLISTDGYILTNNHVVAGSDTIKVAMGIKNKEVYDARLVGADPDTDVALIKIEAKGLPFLPVGDSDSTRVGDWVAAIGSPFNFPHTFTVGVVSAKGRRLGVGNYDDFIQTDASINTGNSGGPLINMRGEVVGINTMIISPSGGNVGIGFSTPINLVKMILPQLKQNGKVTRSWLGVTITPLTGEAARALGLGRPHGAHVIKVVVGSPADKAGIEVDDVIVEFDGHSIKDSSELPALASSYGVGRAAELALMRTGEKILLEVVLEKLPGPRELASLRVKGGASVDNILGVGVRDLTEDDRQALGLHDLEGVLVVEVVADGIGATNGIELEDLINKINGSQIKNISDFEKALGGLRRGSYAKISIRRGNANIFRVFRLTK